MRNKKSNLTKLLSASLVGTSLLFSGCTQYIKLREIRIKTVQDFTDKSGLEEVVLSHSSGFIDMYHPELRKPVKVEKLIIQKIQPKDAKRHLPYIVPFPLTKSLFEAQLNSFLNQEDKDYFPIAQGNNWTYRRTRSLDTKVSEEIYTIHDKGKGDFWKVKVEGDETNMQIKSKEWGYHDFGLLERIEEKSGGEYFKWVSMLNPNIIVDYSSFEMGTIRHKEPVTVPAGTFSDILKCIIMFNGKNIEEVLLENSVPKYIDGELVGDTHRQGSTSLTMESYFAKNVGLIKGVQYNDKGKETYRLELKSYTIK